MQTGNTIKVFFDSEVNAAAKADVTKVLTIEKKKKSTTYKGTEFLNAYLNVGAFVKKEPWFTVRNVELTDGIADPNNKDDKRNEFEGTRLQLQTTVSKCGEFGQFLVTMNPQWRKQITDMGAANQIDLEGKKIHDLLQTNLSKKNEKNPGGVIEDPIIRFQIDFAPFPQKYPHSFLRGQPKTQFFDARTEYKDEQGRTQYKLATIEVDDGAGGTKEEPVTDKNVHLFVTKGSVIVSARINAPSVPVSSSWVSWPFLATRVVLMPGGAGGFSDEDEMPTQVVNKNVADALTGATTTPTISTPTPVVTAPTTDAPVASTSVDDIDAALAGI